MAAQEDVDDVDFELGDASDILLGTPLRPDDATDFSQDEALESFFYDWAGFLGRNGDEKGNILHQLIEKMKEGDIDQLDHLKDAIIMIVQVHPHLVWTDQRGHDNTMPLWLAVEKKRGKMIMAFMEGLKRSRQNVSDDMREALKQCGNQGRTILHKVIEGNIAEAAIQAILVYASEDILKIKDAQGRTPLHLAVGYGDCTADRVDTIRKMLQLSHSSLTITDKSHDSIYTYHVRTEEEWLKRQKSLKEANDAKDIKQDATRADPKLDSRGAAGGVRRQQEEDLDPKSANKAKQAQSHRQRDHNEVQRKNIDGQKEARHANKRVPEGHDHYQDHGFSDGGMDQNPRPNQGSRREPLLSPAPGISRVLSFKQDMEGGERTQLPRNRDEVPSIEAGTPGRSRKRNKFDEERRAKERQRKEKRRDEEDKIKARERAKRTPSKLEQNSKIVKLEIKLRCMRTLSPKQTTKVLYGNNPKGIQMCFDFPRRPSIQLDSFIASFKSVKFDEVLQYVAFPSSFTLTESADMEPSSGAKLGREDMVGIFNWLRGTKKVKRIIKVIVNDFDMRPHRDSAIVKCLSGLQVEDLQWLKADMDPATILKISQGIRKIRLRWSGSNTALRAWSDPYGLRKLQHLSTVHLDLAGDEVLESSEDTQKNIDNFTHRLNTPHNLSVDENDGEKLSRADGIRVIPSGMEIFRRKATTTTGSDKEMNNTHTENHKWLRTMDKFSHDIDQLWNKAQDTAKAIPAKASLAEPIVVALIDDGVDLLDSSLQGRHFEGKSLSYDMENHSEPTEQREHAFWDSSGGHGTIMANLIFRVCPMVKLYVIKMETHADSDGRGRITARSAADAINAAVEKKVNIISMSWTVGQADEGASEDLKKAVQKAHAAKILMFASSSDGGHYKESSWPVAIHRDAFFRIGAAKADGKPYDFAGPVAELNYTFPGVDVFKSPTQPPHRADGKLQQRLAEMKTETGSSVATALAAGTAAMVLTCMRIGAIVAQDSSSGITPHALEKMQERNNMIITFDRLGTRLGENKFIEVWETLNTKNWTNFHEGRPQDKMKIIGNKFSTLLPSNAIEK